MVELKSLSETYGAENLSEKYFGTAPQPTATATSGYVCRDCYPSTTTTTTTGGTAPIYATAPTMPAEFKMSPEQKAQLEVYAKKGIEFVKKRVELSPEQQEHLKKLIGEEAHKFSEWVKARLHREEAQPKAQEQLAGVV